MESLKASVIAAALLAVAIAASMAGQAAAADAPAPSPFSAASGVVPAGFASLAALTFGLMFC